MAKPATTLESKDQVRQIFRLKEGGLTQKKIASKFSVSRRLIGKILNGERWAEVYKEEVSCAL